MTTVLLKAAGLWLALLMLAILNGTVREKWLFPALGEQTALPLSGIFLSALVLAGTWVMVPVLGRLTPPQYWLIGGTWALMTTAFDFLFGHYVGGKPWPTLLAAYNPANGNLWLLVLAVTAAAPYVAARLRGF